MKGKPVVLQICVLCMPYFDSKRSNIAGSWFQCLRAGNESIWQIPKAFPSIFTWTSARHILLSSAPSCSLSTVYTAHLWGPCQHLQESLIEYVSTIFSEELSTQALYQPSLGQGTELKQALRETYFNASEWNSKWQQKEKNNHALLSEIDTPLISSDLL